MCFEIARSHKAFKARTTPLPADALFEAQAYSSHLDAHMTLCFFNSHNPLTPIPVYLWRHGMYVCAYNFFLHTQYRFKKLPSYKALGQVYETFVSSSALVLKKMVLLFFYFL